MVDLTTAETHKKKVNMATEAKKVNKAVTQKDVEAGTVKAVTVESMSEKALAVEIKATPAPSPVRGKGGIADDEIVKLKATHLSFRATGEVFECIGIKAKGLISKGVATRV